MNPPTDLDSLNPPVPPQPAGDLSDQRVRDLEAQVAQLESELERYRQKEPFWKKVRRKIKPLLALLAILLLAAIPAWLVFRDRWQNTRLEVAALQKLWQQIPLLVKTSLPPYFLIVFVCSLALFIIVLAMKSAGANIFRAWQVEALPDRRAISERQQKAARFLLIAAIVIALATFIFGWFNQKTPGTGFSLALVAYLAGWLCLEVRFSSLARRIWAAREPILAALIFQIALIWFLRNLAFEYRFEWISVVLLALAAIFLGRYIRQMPAVFWLINLALVLFTINVNSWAFSVIGDDFAFFNHALRILETQKPLQIVSQIFDGQAVYSSHPYFSSLLQALSMALFGRDNFGWRFSNLFLAAISVGLFYAFFKRFLNVPIALLTAVLLAGSSYLMTFGKIGYNNTQALFTLALGLWATAWAIQSNRPLAYVTLGISLGISFYVYPAALYGIFPCVLLLLIYRVPRSWQVARAWFLSAVSLLLVILPLFLQPGYWQAKLPGLVINNPEITRTTQTTIDHFATNLIQAFYSFLYIVNESHFVVVSYLDLLSGVFLLIGLAFTFKYIGKQRFSAFLIAGFAILLVLVGTSHDRQFPPTTRMFLLLPWFALFTAIGLNWMVEQAFSLELFQVKRSSVFLVILAVILGANVYQAYNLSLKRSTGQQSMEVMFVRFLQKVQNFENIADYPKTFAFLTDPSWGIDGYLLLQHAYAVPAAQTNMRRIIVQNRELPLSTLDFLKERNTMVIVQPGLQTDLAEAYKTTLAAIGKFPCDIKEYSGKDTRFTVWLSPDFAPLCQ
jgi:4-amino-4-deoxy-L-arabinose transferase-like glycosyltransferase